MCKVDKLSWLPFAMAVLIWLFEIFHAAYSEVPSSTWWKTLLSSDYLYLVLIGGGLPSIVIASSFFNYPMRRILEASVSVVSFLMQVHYDSPFFYAAFRYPSPISIRLCLVGIGATIKTWLLLDSRTNKTETIRKPTP
jgi:hypothetical protein